MEDVASVLAVRLSESPELVSAGWHEALPSVYSARGGQPLWMDIDARDAALEELRNALYDGTMRDSASVSTLYAAARATSATDSSLAAFDIHLTDSMLRLGDSLATPGPDPHELYGNLWFPTTRDSSYVPPSFAKAVSLDSSAGGSRTLTEAVRTWAASMRPHSNGFNYLRLALVRESVLRDAPELGIVDDLAPGDTGIAVVTLRERLLLEGLPSRAEDVRVFDDSLAGAVRLYQARLVLDVTERVDVATRRALNKRRPELIPIMQLNLERWRWLPDTLGRYRVWVNIPEFELAVIDTDAAGAETEVLRSKVVVGTRGWETPVMSDLMEYLVFNPTWTIPASIQMESYGKVNPRGMVRDPGPGNPLGRVKFIFPNDYAIYIHDTPSKWSFGQERRAYSHGCVRAADPRDLSIALMTHVNGWTKEDVDSIFDGPWTLRTENLARPVPVHLVYMTAVADSAGRVRVVDDVYRHDPKQAEALGILLPDLPPPSPRSEIEA